MNHLEEGPTSSEEAELLPHERQPVLRRGAWRAFPLTLALVAAAAVLTYAAGRSQTQLQRLAARPAVSDLFSFDDDPCNLLPYLRIHTIIRDNLGNDGPDKDVPEGIVYGARAHHTGLNQTDVEIHLNVVSERYFGVDVNMSNRPNHTSRLYHPEWPRVNGITGHFGTINIQPGTNVTLLLRGYDPHTQQYIHMPAWAMTIFDLDCGRGGDHGVEFLKINNFKSYFVSNQTELDIRQEGEYTMFSGTVEGTGVDNPDDPLNLTVLQKNRAVSFEFEDTDHVIFELGASPGADPRVFQFVVRPIMRCANTVVKGAAGDIVLAAGDPANPVVAVEGHGAHPSHPSHTHASHEDEDDKNSSHNDTDTGAHNGTHEGAARRKRNSANRPAQPAAIVVAGLAALAAHRVL